MVSRFSRLRTPLAMRLCSRFHPLSWRFVRYPTTAVAPLRSSSSTRSGRLSRSSYTGTTSETSTGDRPDILQLGRIGMLRGKASDQGVGFGGVFLVRAINLGEPDPRDYKPVGGGGRHGAN